MRPLLNILFVLISYTYASSVEPECVNGTWVHQTADQLPHIDCSRTPPAVRWSALTPERCRAWQLDSDWPTQDTHITRRASWRSARSLAMTKLRNKRLWILGDSISSLFYHGIVCELYRHGLDAITDYDLQREVDDVDPETWGSSGPPFRLLKWPIPNMTLVGKGWHRVFKDEWREMFRLGDVFLFNYGLHYSAPDKELFIEDYEWLLNECNTRLDKVCVWREMSAQLFLNGAYDKNGNNGEGACKANPDALFSNENWVWQQNVLVRTMIETRFTHVRILPFYNLSSVRGDQTELSFCARESERANPGTLSTCLDCTHGLMTPTLWAKIVDEIYKIVA